MDATTRTRPVSPVDVSVPEAEDRTIAALGWLSEQFPGWRFRVDRTATYSTRDRQLWIASRAGHHDQSELTAAKLHTRLSDYLDREDRRRALMN